MKKALGIVAILLITMSATAANLAQIYQQALVSDPTFKKAQADWLTAKQAFTLALTGNGNPGTGILPNFGFVGILNTVSQRVSNTNGAISDRFGNNGITLSLTQPLFNLSTWMSISSARYSVRAATAQYLAAAQDLMKRVAIAYFEVLRANDTLGLTLTAKEQFRNQLVSSEEKFKVGLIAITGVYDAQASYDRAIAKEVKDRNTLQDQLENLRAITGVFYASLARLKPNIPLVTPRPNNINQWVILALKQNYLIQADLNLLLSSRENVKAAATGNAPTINLVGQYSDITSGIVATPPFQGLLIPNTRTQTASVGVTLNFPMLRGGYDYVNTKRAHYQYLSASDKLEIDHRVVENDTRQAFLNISAGISQIKASQRAIISSRNQLEATKAGYIVGTRTMVDVLNSVTDLTQTQLSYADNRYNYIEGIFLLKENAGTLAPSDINRINTWLSKGIRFDLQQPKIVERDPGVYKGDLLDINTPEQTEPIQEKDASKPSIYNNDIIETSPSDPEPLVPPASVQKQEKLEDTFSTQDKNNDNKPATQQQKNKLQRMLDELLEKATRSNHDTQPTSKQNTLIPNSSTPSAATHTTYALELFSSKNKMAAENYYKKYQQNALIYLHETTKNNQVWYQVLYGKYHSLQEALNALYRLSEPYIQSKPWVVKVAPISNKAGVPTEIPNDS